MKRTALFLLVLIIGSLLTAHPVSETVTEESVKTEVRVAALKGPTAMGLVKLMDEAGNTPDELENSYSFVIESAPDAVTPLIAKNEVDFACIPANLAAVLYNNTGKIKVVAVNTLGVLYLVGSSDIEINSVEDIKGRTIYSSGKGSTPQYAVETILEGYGLVDGVDVTVEWKSEHAECVAALLADSSALAVLPQPFATSAMMQNSSLTLLADLNDLWKEIAGTSLITGVTVVNKDFAENNPEAVDAFLEEYAASAEWVNSNIEEAAELIENAGIIKAAVARKALDKCNIVVWTGDKLKANLSVYLEALYNQNPKSVGGSVPGEEFYY